MIRPLHSRTFSTASLSTAASGTTGWKVPSVKSAGWEAASLRLSIDFGVNTISGRCCSPSECLRSRWK